MSERVPIRHVPGFPDGRSAATRTNDLVSETAPPEILVSASDLSIGWAQGPGSYTLSSGITLAVQAGHLIALVGPNGSGKSTLLRTLAGLQRRISGSIFLLGKELSSLDAEERARRTACVFNERLDSGYFSVFDIVAFGRYPYTDARNSLKAEDRRHVEQALEVVGMESFAKRAFSALSDGEKQKVNIARAIAQETKVLVFDEPTAFLDAPSRIEIFHMAEKLAHEGRKAVILCTHEVDLALRSADEMWIMDREHRFSSGTPSVVAYSGAIGKAFETPNVRFDPSTGTFKVGKASRRGA